MCVCVYLFNIFIEQFLYLVIILCNKSESESCSVMTNSVTPWTVACQPPLPREFSRPEHWSGYLFLPPGDLPNPGIESRSPALQTDSLPAEPPGKCPLLCDKVVKEIQYQVVYILERKDRLNELTNKCWWHNIRK